MDIENFLNSVYANITSKTERRSITPVIVGNTFRDLALLTKQNVEAIGVDFAPISGSTNYIQNIPSSGIIQTGGIKISDAIIIGNNNVVLNSDGTASIAGSKGSISFEGGDHITLVTTGQTRALKIDPTQSNGNFTNYYPGKNGTLATLDDIPSGNTVSYFQINGSSFQNNGLNYFNPQLSGKTFLVEYMGRTDGGGSFDRGPLIKDINFAIIPQGGFSLISPYVAVNEDVFLISGVDFRQAESAGKQDVSQKNQPNGYAGLDNNGNIVGQLQNNFSIQRGDSVVAPSSATDTGTKGEVRLVNGYLYWCTNTNTWIRTALTTF